MGFFERLPYTNKHGLNEDWLIDTVKGDQAAVKEMQDQVTELTGRVDAVEETVSGFAGDLSSLDSRMTAAEGQVNTNKNDIIDLKAADVSLDHRLDIVEGYSADISDLENRVEEVNNNSITRDNSLGNRVSLLESAVINPIDVYTSNENRIAGGDDLRNLPTWTEPGSGKVFPYPWYSHNDSCTINYDPATGFYLASGTFSEMRYKAEDLAMLQGYASLSDEITITAAVSDVTTDPGNDLYTTDIATVSATLSNTDWQYAGSYIRVGINTDGSFSVRLYDATYWTTHRLVGIKLEKGDTSSGLILSSRDQILMKFAKDYADASMSTPVHYTGSVDFPVGEITTDPPISWTDSPAFAADFDLYKWGHVLMGNIHLHLGDSQTGAVTITDLTTGAKTIDVSDLHLPKALVTGSEIGSYIDIIGREQYKIYVTNGSTYLSTMTLYPFFTSKTTASDGTIANLTIAYPC